MMNGKQMKPNDLYKRAVVITNKPLVTILPVNCSWCNKPLIEFSWNKECYIWVCDNPFCSLYCSPQGSRKKDIYVEDEEVKVKRWTRRLMNDDKAGNTGSNQRV